MPVIGAIIFLLTSSSCQKRKEDATPTPSPTSVAQDETNKTDEKPDTPKTPEDIKATKQKEDEAAKAKADKEAIAANANKPSVSPNLPSEPLAPGQAGTMPELTISNDSVTTHELKKGLLPVEISIKESSETLPEFGVRVYSAAGSAVFERVILLPEQTIGTYRFLIEIPADGVYLFSWITKGKTTIKSFDLQVLDPIKETFTGDLDGVGAVYKVSSNLVLKFDARYDGKTNFMVRVNRVRLSGESGYVYGGLLANEIGKTSKSGSIKLTPGYYYINVQAIANWRVVVSASSP